MTDGITVTVEALKAKAAEIARLDDVLDAQSGSKAAGKKAIKNRLVSESANQDFIQRTLATMRDSFSEEEIYATFFAFVDALEGEFADEADGHVEGIIEAQQTEQAEKLSDAEVAEIQEDRKNKVQEFKALKNILEMFGQDVDSVPEPKIRRGSRGPRGPRTLSKFQYRVNDTELESDVNSLASVAKLANVKVKELKDFITNQGVDLKNPPAEWSAALPNGVGTLFAAPLPEFADEFGEDEDAA